MIKTRDYRNKNSKTITVGYNTNKNNSITIRIRRNPNRIYNTTIRKGRGITIMNIPYSQFIAAFLLKFNYIITCRKEKAININR